MKRHGKEHRLSRLRGRVVCAGIALGLGVVAVVADSAAEEKPTMTLTIGTVSGALGGIANVPISLSAFGESPVTLVMSVVYDPVQLEFGSVEAGPSVPESKLLLHNADVPGYATFILYGIDTAPIENGVILSVKFDVLDAELGEFIPVSAGSNVSGATALGVSFDVVTADGGIQVSCVAPNAPGNVTASRGRTDGVLVTWNSVPGATGYRVFRNSVDNPFTATALGSEWQASLSFLDTTAPPADITLPSNQGCSGSNSGTITNQFYYWVKARTTSDCESAFSLPALGYRLPGVTASRGASGESPPHRAPYGDGVVMASVTALFVCFSRKAGRRVSRRR